MGKPWEPLLIQRRINNPLLVEGHKYKLRAYMLIASTNPLIVYSYDGLLIVSSNQYDPKTKDKSNPLTDTEPLQQDGNSTSASGKHRVELEAWGLQKLADYLAQQKKLDNSAWLEEHLRLAFQRAMQHLVRMTQSSLYKSSSVWELLEVDFILDEDFNLWFIECHSNPSAYSSSEEQERFLVKMLKDQFDIVFGYLRSRIKRVIVYINDLQDEPGVQQLDDRLVIDDLEPRRKQFQLVIANRLEPEYLPGDENGWALIVR